ncbi:MAG TPA: TetR/AcrR family transcriptional regulator [Ktedonobacteraceae bacterium]|jgi:AcrR family transcriptional regulator|nr:TetR/AcrR family transcriptional regulator [Ktedonobacteraceae bacterium]
MARNNTLVERRAEIINATIRVLARDGIAETTTRKIAAEAGVNQATLRYYFGSKDDLLFAVLQEMMQLTAQIVRESTLAKRSISDMIVESIKAFWSHVESEPELQVIQYELTLYALRNPESAWLAKQQYDGYAAVVEDLLRKNFEESGAPCAIPFAELARFIIGGLDGLILQFISDRNTERARRDLGHLITAVIALVEGRSST